MLLELIFENACIAKLLFDFQLYLEQRLTILHDSRDWLSLGLIRIRD